MKNQEILDLMKRLQSLESHKREIEERIQILIKKEENKITPTK